MAQRHPLRILLAEDNIVNQKVALRILERLGYRPDVAANGLEVLQALQRQTYDVVLMDVQMPEMDGLEAARRINERWPRTQRPRLIAMTAYALEGDRERCIEAGMDDYVSKPIRVEELVKSLEQAHAPPHVSSGTPHIAAGNVALDANPHMRAAVDRTVLESLRSVLHAEVDDVIGIYLENGAKLLEEMHQALARQDAPSLERAAHTLKSSSATFGATALSDLCRELEQMGRQDQLGGAAEQISRITGEFDRVRAELSRPEKTRPRPTDTQAGSM